LPAAPPEVAFDKAPDRDEGVRAEPMAGIVERSRSRDPQPGRRLFGRLNMDSMKLLAAAVMASGLATTALAPRS
jgi:hypothetical protein